MSEDQSGNTIRALLGHRPYVLFLSARVMSAFCQQIQAVAIGWQIYAMTHRSIDLGLIGLAQFLPMIMLTLVVGHVADHYDRRRVVSTSRMTSALCVAVLALGTYMNWLTPDGLYATVIVLGASRAFDNPTNQALLPALVPKTMFQRAVALNSTGSQASQIIGPALGGLLYGWDPVAPYAIAAALFLLSGICMALIPGARPVGASKKVSLETIFSGFTFIRRNRAVLGSISLDLFAVLLGGATALLPVYARDILVTGPWGLGLLRSGTAFGALIMAVTLGRFPLKRGVGKILFGAVMSFGIATVVFGVSTNLALSIAALIVLGASDMVSVVIRTSLVQLLTPDEMRGRVSAVDSLFTGTSNFLGEFESGVTASLFGTVPAVLIGGFGTMLVAGTWMILFPEIRRIRTLAG